MSLTNAERQEVRAKADRMNAILRGLSYTALWYICFLGAAYLLPPLLPLSASVHYAVVTDIVIVIGTLTALITIGPRVKQRLREYFELGARVRELAEKSL